MDKKLTTYAFLSVLLIGPTSIHAEGTGQLREEDNYLKIVGNVLGSHIQALELITRIESKYSGNVVRHAVALRDTSGLLKHGYPEEDKKRKWPWKDKKEFERKAYANLQASKQLEKAASKWLKDRDRKKFLVSLDKLKQTCRGCHGDMSEWP